MSNKKISKSRGPDFLNKFGPQTINQTEKEEQNERSLLFRKLQEVNLTVDLPLMLLPPDSFAP